MEGRRPTKLDDPLPAAVATRLLDRAGELDAVRSAGSSIADLRAAASEAGISTAAFDAAVAELEAAESRVPDVPAPTRRRSRWPIIIVALVALAALGVIAVSRTSPAPVPTAGAPMVEEAILLRCLSPEDAAALIRPVIQPTGMVVIRPGGAHVLTIRATPTQLKDVKALLEKYEGAGATCPAR